MPAKKPKHWSTKLPRDACKLAKKWARTQPSYAAAWRNCENGYWMDWLIISTCPGRLPEKFYRYSREAHRYPGEELRWARIIRKHYPKPPKLGVKKGET